MIFRTILELAMAGLVVYMYLHQDKLIVIEYLLFTRRGRKILKKNFEREFLK